MKYLPKYFEEYKILDSLKQMIILQDTSQPNGQLSLSFSRLIV